MPAIEMLAGKSVDEINMIPDGTVLRYWPDRGHDPEVFVQGKKQGLVRRVLLSDCVPIRVDAWWVGVSKVAVPVGSCARVLAQESGDRSQESE